jgi:hypothetical protein
VPPKKPNAKPKWKRNAKPKRQPVVPPKKPSAKPRWKRNAKPKRLPVVPPKKPSAKLKWKHNVKLRKPHAVPPKKPPGKPRSSPRHHPSKSSFTNALGLGYDSQAMRFLLPLLLLVPLLQAQQPAAPKPKPPAYLTAEEAGEDFIIQGEYSGLVGGEKTGVQVWAKGKGEFEIIAMVGGLPGAGWLENRKQLERLQARREPEKKVASLRHESSDITIDGSTMQIEGPDIKVTLKKESRTSPTLGAKPPAGAVVLFDGQGVNRFPNSKIDEKLQALQEGITSEDTFHDCSLHIEFMLPFMPEARGQGRGNSGLYLQGRYEVQMLDSFALDGKDNECGGLYKIASPRINMCLPPLTWQTYDVDFTAAKYDETGQKLVNAKITVKHNGVLIHENQELPGPTAAARFKEDAIPGPLYLQNHGNPVRYRNIWVVRK